MAVTRQQVVELYVATFNRAPDADGLDYWVNLSGLTIEEIAQSFFDQAETQTLYPEGTTDTAFVTSIYTNLFNRAPDAAGLAYWEGELASGNMTRSVMIEAMKNGALGADAILVANKATVGLYYADAGLQGTDFSLASVTAYESSVTAAIAEVDNIVTTGSTGTTFTLTTGIDTITGTDANDTINGTDTTLTGLDSIDGGNGTDTLVVNDIAAGGTDFSAVGFTVANVETANFRSAGATLTVDSSTWTGLTALNVTQAKAVDLTAAATTAVSVSGATGAITVDGGLTQTVTTAGTTVTLGATTVAAGAINVTHTAQATNAIAINGGTDVTVATTIAATTAAVDGGDTTIGNTTQASGAVVVTQNLTSTGGSDDAHDLTAANIAVTGGSTVNVTVNSTSTATVAGADGDIVNGSVTVTGDGATTAVTVTQNATATTFTTATVAMVADTEVVTFVALATGESVTVNGLTFTASTALTAAEVAAAFADLTVADTQDNGGEVANGIYTGSFDLDGDGTTDWTSGAASGATVTFTGADNTVDAMTISDTAAAGNVASVATAGTAASGGVATTNTVTLGAVRVDDVAAESITTVTLDSYLSADLGKTGADLDALTTLSLTDSAGTAEVATDSTTLALTVNDVLHNVELDETGATIENLTITATGAASAFLLEAAAVTDLTIDAAVALDISTSTMSTVLENVTVTGAGAVNLGDITGAVTLNTFNASGNTGGVTAEVEVDDATITGGITEYIFSEGNDVVTLTATTGTANERDITLGAGDDLVDLEADAIVSSTQTIDGGTGTDTLYMTAADAETASATLTFETYITGFEKLKVANAASNEVINLANMDDISYVIAGAGAGTAQTATFTVQQGTAEAGDVYAVTINGRTFSYTTLGTEANDKAVADAIVALINADTTLLVTAGAGTAADPSVVTLTADTAGVPFSVAVAITDGATADATLTTAAGTANAYGLLIDGMASGGTLELTDALNADVDLTDASGTADVLNIVATLSTANKAASLDLTDIETLNITVNDADLDDNDDGTNEIRTETLHLYANEAKTVTVDGNSNLTLSFDNTTDEITTINASALTGALTVTANSGTAAMTITGGSGADVLTASGSSDVLIGGAGNDTLTGADLTTLTGGDGVDTFVMAVPTNVNTYATITDASSGDKITITGADSFASAGITLADTAVFQDYANAAANGAATDDDASWFNYGANTYIVYKDTAATVDFANGVDSIIKISGVIDLTTASFNATTATLEIA